jgi:hypothetical protein
MKIAFRLDDEAWFKTGPKMLRSQPWWIPVAAEALREDRVMRA